MDVWPTYPRRANTPPPKVSTLSAAGTVQCLSTMTDANIIQEVGLGNESTQHAE